MGWFKKEETTHFERNQAGEVVSVTRNGKSVDPEELQMKSSQQLEREYYEKHPQEKHKTLRKIGSVAKKVDQQILNYNRRNNPIRQKPYSSRVKQVNNNFNPFGSMFDTGMNYKQPKRKKTRRDNSKFVIVHGKAYPIVGGGKKKKKRRSKSRSGRKTSGGFDMMDNWRLMK